MAERESEPQAGLVQETSIITEVESQGIPSGTEEFFDVSSDKKPSPAFKAAATKPAQKGTKVTPIKLVGDFVPRNVSQAIGTLAIRDPAVTMVYFAGDAAAEKQLLR